jgi:hypothetical protein
LFVSEFCELLLDCGVVPVEGVLKVLLVSEPLTAPGELPWLLFSVPVTELEFVDEDSVVLYPGVTALEEFIVLFVLLIDELALLPDSLVPGVPIALLFVSVPVELNSPVSFFAHPAKRARLAMIMANFFISTPLCADEAAGSAYTASRSSLPAPKKLTRVLQILKQRKFAFLTSEFQGARGSGYARGTAICRFFLPNTRPKRPSGNC